MLRIRLSLSMVSKKPIMALWRSKLGKISLSLKIFCKYHNTKTIMLWRPHNRKTNVELFHFPADNMNIKVIQRYPYEIEEDLNIIYYSNTFIEKLYCTSQFKLIELKYQFSSMLRSLCEKSLKNEFEKWVFLFWFSWECYKFLVSWVFPKEIT